MIAVALEVGPARWRRRTDVVVVGSGAAGLCAALRLIDAGRRVTLLTKGRLGDGSTVWAQGGLAAVIDPNDSVRGHIQDTLEAGAGLCDETAVADLAAAAPRAIRELTRLGARFDREPNGHLALGLEGGHHARRIVHAGGDATGAEIARVLAAAVTRAAAHRRAEVLEGALAVDALLSADDRVCGLRLIAADGRIGELEAEAVVLATGGIGQAWPVTSNPATATGDGLALALRAGALICDVEFVQFHPTALVPPAAHRWPGDRTALISEALRGEGARLIDVDGTAIMTGVHPLGDLAPRDVVATAIHRRMTSTSADHVLLDATGLAADAWRDRFPTIFALCVERGVDPRTDPIPVAPAEHYACGGVWANLDGVTSLPGLYAVGEVASTGVQGANRLASNGLTEAVIAGDRVADLLNRIGPQRRAPVDQQPRALLDCDLRPKVVAATGHGAGVLRHDRGLRAQLTALAELAAPPRPSRKPARPGGSSMPAESAAWPALLEEHDIPAAMRASVETTNLHTVSTMIAIAALHRTESRGCHRRSDYPEPRPDWQRRQPLQLIDGEIRPVPAKSENAA